VATVIPQKDYVRFLLTGERCTDASDAAGTALFDQAEGTWDCELSRLAGVDLSALPEIRLPLASGGVVTVSGARRTGLRRGTPVIVGATDTAAELISLGLVAEGWLAKIASTGTVVAVDGAPRPDPLVMTYPHVTADVWYQVAATNFAAQSRTWAARILGLDATTASGAAAFDRLASRAPAGSHGLLFLPFLAGERTPYWDSELRAAFVGLTAAHSRADLARAVLEGVAFSIRACRAALGDTRGQLTLSGGGVRSSLWRRILVSALGERARLVAPQGPALGAALLALAASYDRPLKPPPGRRVTSVAPNAAWCASYDRLYRIYQDAAAAMTSISHRLQR
jgi:xylulokinase